jgi:hypothetical protein
MAEFTKQRAGKPVPLVVLPRGGSYRSTEWAPKVVEIYLVLGKKPAGCLICNRVIPAQATRLMISIRFPSGWADPEDLNTGKITTLSYYLHPGCITDRIKPEVIRFGAKCYDCGAMPPASENPRGFEEFLHRCFTVSKFAPGRLCATCAKKPRWRYCHVCEVYFPHWMISRVASHLVKPIAADFGPFEVSEAEVETGTDVCEFCAARHHLVTEEQAAETATEYERLRREILEQGIFDAGDD